jgi:hypothetical protein
MGCGVVLVLPYFEGSVPALWREIDRERRDKAE